MSKAILVIDMTEKCLECPILNGNDECILQDEDADSPEFEWVKGNVIKGYRYRDGVVSMKSDDGRIIWCGVETSDFRKSDESLGDFISNADRIRSMSDEELAEFLANFAWDNEPTKKETYEWLQSEVEE